MSDNQIIIVLHPDSPQEPYSRALTRFSKVHFSTSAVEALQFLETSPANMAFIETQCQDMTGIEIAEAIRDIDADANHFTYICLIGAESIEMLTDVAAANADTHLPAADQHVTAIALVGQRIAEQINSLTAQNIELKDENLSLQHSQLLDPLTGLGNARMAEQSLTDSISQIESRGGAVCVLMLAVNNFSDVAKRYDAKISNDFIIAVSAKINQLVRPLDIVTYLGDGRFAFIMVQPTIEQCTAECYQRLFDGVSAKSFRTPVGYIEADIAMSLCASHADAGAPSPQRLFSGALKALREAVMTKRVTVTHLTPIE